MKRKIALFATISASFAALCYLLTSNIIISSIVLAIFLLVFLIILNLWNSYDRKRKRKHESYRFINSFIISLSATRSLQEAYESALLSFSEEDKEIMLETEDLTVEEKLQYLAKYFPDDIYKVFVAVISLFEEEGGEILDVAAPLMKESLTIEEELIEHEKNVKRSILEFGSLWVMSAIIIGILRFGLSSFYGMLIVNNGYLGTCFVYFLVTALSFYLYAKGITKERIRVERKKNGKKKKN